VTPPGSPELGDPRLLGYRRPRAPPVVLSRVEVILTRLFLRRYVPWCARSGPQIQPQWAADLWRRVRVLPKATK